MNGVGWRSWYRAMRPRTLSAAVSPVLVGSALVLALGDHFSVIRFLLALAGSVAIQAATNMLNEYFDHKQGLDLGRFQRPDMVVQTGEISHDLMLRGGVATMAFGAACGLVLVWLTGPSLLLVGILSVLAGWAYTARPLALGYRALGEVTVFIFMGPVIVMGAYFVHTGAWSTDAFLLSIPMGLLVAAILHVNNVRDMKDDVAHGKRTLANLFGRRVAGYEYAFLTLGGYAILAVLMALGRVPWPALLVVLSLPGALKLARALAGDGQIMRLDRVMVGTAKLHLRFGVLLAIGLVVEAVRVRL